MPCSRMPEVAGSARTGCPATSPSGGWPGMNDGSPSIVVRLLSARSAEPPHSFGQLGAPSAVQDGAGGLAGGHALGVGREPSGRASAPAVRQALRDRHPVETAPLGLRVGLGPGGERILPLRVGVLAALGKPRRAWFQRLVLDREVDPRGSKCSIFFGRLHLGHAECGRRGPRRFPCLVRGRGQPMMVPQRR